MEVILREGKKMRGGGKEGGNAREKELKERRGDCYGWRSVHIIPMRQQRT